MSSSGAHPPPRFVRSQLYFTIPVCDTHKKHLTISSHFAQALFYFFLHPAILMPTHLPLRHLHFTSIFSPAHTHPLAPHGHRRSESSSKGGWRSRSRSSAPDAAERPPPEEIKKMGDWALVSTCAIKQRKRSHGAKIRKWAAVNGLERVLARQTLYIICFLAKPSPAGALLLFFLPRTTPLNGTKRTLP